MAADCWFSGRNLCRSQTIVKDSNMIRLCYNKVKGKNHKPFLQTYEKGVERPKLACLKYIGTPFLAPTLVY